MSKTKFRHAWCKKSLNETISSNVSQALRNTHRDTNAAVKHIAMVTGAREDTIEKWYRGVNPPDSAHLLVLMRHYPAILQTVLEMIGREDLWGSGVRAGIPPKMNQALIASNGWYKIWGDMHVTPPDDTTTQNSVRLNDRQLWFLDELVRRRRMQNKDIVSFWGIAKRTAKRDTEGLIHTGLIRTVRGGSNSWYELTGVNHGR
jgi:hypothetical protein